MRKSVYARVRQQVERRGRGAVFVTREMLPLGSRAAVDEALARLAREEFIRRLGRGLYDYPRLHPQLGPVPADPDAVALALARKTGARVQGSGARAANALGLSPQVPARPAYLTDGRPRTVRVGGQTIELRHAAPRTMAGAGQAGGAVIQALRHLGPDHIDADAVERLRGVLTAREKAALRREAPGAPAWLAPILQDIARPDEKSGEQKIGKEKSGAGGSGAGRQTDGGTEGTSVRTP